MRRNEPIYLSNNARDNNLMDKPKCKILHRYAKNIKKTNRLIKADNYKKCRNALKIKFEMNIPRDHKGETMFDSKNGNNKWKDADIIELKQIYNFDPFDYLRPVNSAHIPPGHTKIHAYLI